MYCKVCGDQASGYFNNGGLSCSSCRVFFRRMAIKPYIRACNQESSCEISLENRTTSCKYCRYQKCLKIGMDPNLVGKSNKKRGEILKKDRWETINKCTNNLYFNMFKLFRHRVNSGTGFFRNKHD